MDFMKKETIRKSIEICAPKEKVWDVLFSDKFTRIWYAEFSEGSHALTDWKVGSKAIFIDNSQNGIIGKIIENKLHEAISIEYEGVVTKNVEDYQSAAALGVKGGLETYHLAENNGATHVSIECDMDETAFGFMSKAWDKAIMKIKSLSEKE